MKKSVLVLMLAAVVALLFCCVLLLGDDKTGKTEEVSEKEFFTVKTVSEEITEIRIVNPEGMFAFEKKAGEWYNVFTTSVKSYGNTIYGIESILKQTMAVDDIEKNVTSMSKYGLDKPSVTVKYTAGGIEGFLKIGNSVLGTKYYFTVDGENVYTMDSSEAGLFFAGMRAFSDMSLTKMEISEINKVTVYNYGERLIVEKKKDDELKKEGAEALFTYALRSPVKENASPNDVQKFYSLVSNIGAQSFDPYADEEETGIKGSARWFSYETAKESGRFIIGKAAGKGYTYVKKDGVKGVYKVSDEAIAFMDNTAFDVVDKHISLYYYDEVVSVEIATANEKYKLTLGENPDINGKSISKDDAQEFFRNLISLSYDGSVDDGNEDDEDKVMEREVTITFNCNNKKDITGYMNCDAMNYAVLRNGATEFTIQRKYVDKIVSMLKEL